MRLSRLPQVDYVVSKQSWVGRLLQRPNFELTQLMFFMNRLKQPGGQAFLSSDPAPLGANLLNWTELNCAWWKHWIDFTQGREIAKKQCMGRTLNKVTYQNHA